MQLQGREERDQSVLELKDLIRDKRELEAKTKADIKNLQSKLSAERRAPADQHKQGEYSERLQDFNVAYEDILISSQEHFAMNASIIKKEKELKDLEARVLFMQQAGSDSEYQRMLQIYENEKKTLNDMYFT